MKTKSDKNDRKFFRLIDKNTFPSLMPNTQINDLRKVTVSLVKKRKFIYFDMNATNGFKAMQNVETESDEQDEKLGPYIVCSGSKMSKQKQKLNQFMTINYKTREHRNSMRSRIKQQLKKSLQKFPSPKSSRHQLKSIQRLKFNRGLSNEKFQTIQNKMETDDINQDITKKEEKMMHKLGIVVDFQSVYDGSTPSVGNKQKKTEKYFLPRILKSYT